jgi:muramoyltetrapeptide carboxypeptidase LdcA involved in peptidoglycan recycling
VISDVVGVEFGRPDLPIVLDLDFGHTDPQLTLPNGATVVLDPAMRRVSIPAR